MSTFETRAAENGRRPPHRLSLWHPQPLAWLALLLATGWLVGAEVIRPELPEGVRVVSDRVYREADGRRLMLDVYTPTTPTPNGGRPCLVAFHGGGWRGGSKGEYGRSLTRLVTEGLVVVSADYRLSRPGEPSWPGNLDDVREAVRWVRRHARTFGIDPERVAVMGASAGGHLALLLGCVEQGSDGVKAVIDFYAPTDLRTLHEQGTGARRSLELLFGGTPQQLSDRYDAASPARQVAQGVPPVLIVHGDDDALVPLDQSRSLASALGQVGGTHRLMVVKGARHGFGLVAGTHDLVPEILDFLENVWGGSTRRISREPTHHL